MKRKAIYILVIIVVLVAFLLGFRTSYANNDSIYINFSKNNSYKVSFSDLWNIQKQNSDEKNIYSLKNINLDDLENEAVEYNLSYDLQADRENLTNKTIENEELNNIIKSSLDPNGQTYKQLLWILDNSYIQGKTDINQFLSKAEISENQLTEQEIIVVQKMAIWYFTNYKIDRQEEFNKKDSNDNWLMVAIKNDSNFELIDETKMENIQKLYNYLINNAEQYSQEYTEEKQYMLNCPVNVKTDNLEKQEDGKYKVQVNRVNANYVIGPIVLDKNNSKNYNITFTPTNEKNEIVEYKFSDKDGNEINDVTLENYIGNADGFYITVSRSSAEEINLKLEVTYEMTNKKLWLSGSEEDGKLKLDNEQILIELTQETKNETTELTAKIEEFDLSLRTYIKAINEQNLDNENYRIPQVSLDTLKTGTTAIYNHRKSPVAVNENDLITYEIAIFNEGTISGYASQIIQQLPEGLISSTDNPAEIYSKDKNGNQKNKYQLKYNTMLNTITLDIVNTQEEQIKSLESYSQEQIDYETITLKCKVIQKPDEKQEKILTNIVWISKACDSNGETKTDRDSRVETLPNVDSQKLQTYIGNTNNKTDLTDNNYFYAGQEDDDDFEKVIINAKPRTFDLALFEFVSAISKEQTISSGDYITDTGEKDGNFLRAPKVNINDGNITYTQDDKVALSAEPGNYILYNVRIYNEGQKDGYASKIKVILPIGLEFVVENEEYNGIWNLDGLDSDGRQIVSTTNYAKGQGAEVNSIEGDNNYTANLIKAFNPEENQELDCIDAQVLCKVTEDAASDRVLVTYAQIEDDSNENGEPIDDIDSKTNEWIDNEDDQDIERLKVQCFDLSLRKFITSVNNKELKNSDGTYSREPIVDTSKLIETSERTAIYNHTKQPISVQAGDTIIYTIRVYNEGDINGYASKVTEYLPQQLKFIENSEINQKYGWELSEDGRTVTTTYLSDKEIKSFDKQSSLDYQDIQIECQVSDDTLVNSKLTSISEISEYAYSGSAILKDVDSTANNIISKKDLPNDENLPTYKDSELTKNYIPGNEDDDDFEKVSVKEFDLSLTSFITKVGEKEITDREKLNSEENKEPLITHVGDIVTFTIRVYNDGEIAGYAREITNDISKYLEYLPEESTNVEYMWKMYNEKGEETSNIEETVTLKSTYLSMDNGEDKLLKAFDGTTRYYKDIKIAFKVKDPNSNTVVIENKTQISDDTDEVGKPVKDRDSMPTIWEENGDDQSIETLKVEYFDLSLKTFVSKVIVSEDGVETTTETGYNGFEEIEPVVKVEIQKKKKEVKQETVKIVYGITVTNEGDIPGYATEITDYVPEGLQFSNEDNPDWIQEENNKVSTNKLSGKLLKPGESETINLTLAWINDENNLNEKVNTVEITKEENEHNVPNRDSTPNNQIAEEDDIDSSNVLILIATGTQRTYIILILGLLATVLVGVVLIKKFVI